MSNTGTTRDYRSRHGDNELKFFNVTCEHTDLSIGCEVNQYEEAMGAVVYIRDKIKLEIANDPKFLVSMTPLKTPMICDDNIRLMYLASQLAGVGPMAAVAGCVSNYVGEYLNRFSENVIVENGGDDYIITTKKRTIAIVAGDSPLSGRVGVELLPGKWGVCTSAGKVGPSMS